MKGAGLGIQFLKHIERTKVLVHLVDMSETGRDPIHDFETLMVELESFDEDLGASGRCWLPRARWMWRRIPKR